MPDQRAALAPRSKDRRLKALLDAVCILLAAHFSIAYNTLTTPMVPFSPYKELNGSGGVFAYRMLPALLWKACVAALRPLAMHLPHLNKPFDSDEGWFLVLLTFLAMWGTLLVSRRMLRSVDDRPQFEWMALGMAYAAYFDTILVLNRNLFYPYDVSALFFFTLLVYLAYRARPWAFTLVLLVAMTNKETAIMAVAIYFGLNCDLKRWHRAALLCLAMSGGALAIRWLETLYLHSICAGCRFPAEYQLPLNLHQMANPLFWVSELSVFGFAYVAAILFWHFVPMRVRITAALVALIWVAAMSVVGVLREVRIFEELSAVLLLVIGLGVHGWLVGEQEPV